MSGTQFTGAQQLILQFFLVLYQDSGIHNRIKHKFTTNRVQVFQVLTLISDTLPKKVMVSLKITFK